MSGTLDEDFSVDMRPGNWPGWLENQWKEASVEFKDRTGKTVMVNGGEKVSATLNGLGVKKRSR